MSTKCTVREVIAMGPNIRPGWAQVVVRQPTQHLLVKSGHGVCLPEFSTFSEFLTT